MGDIIFMTNHNHRDAQRIGGRATVTSLATLSQQYTISLLSRKLIHMALQKSIIKYSS